MSNTSELQETCTTVFLEWLVKQITENGLIFQQFNKFYFLFIIFPHLYLYLIFRKWQGGETGTVELKDRGLSQGLRVIKKEAHLTDCRRPRYNNNNNILVNIA